MFKKQEPIQTSGYICNFEDLEIKSVLLDEIMKVKFKKQVALELPKVRKLLPQYQKSSYTDISLILTMTEFYF